MIYGLGRVGKTQVAAEYAHCHFGQQSGYEWVFWIKADTASSLATDFGNLAEMLVLPERQAQKLDEKVAAVKRWLETHDGWLLVFDNFDNVDQRDFVQNFVERYRPCNPKGRILLTSRAKSFAHLGIAQPLEVRDMAPAKAREFLFKRMERQPQAITEANTVNELARELGYLPLALEQAGAYLCQTQALSVEEYSFHPEIWAKCDRP